MKSELVHFQLWGLHAWCPTSADTNHGRCGAPGVRSNSETSSRRVMDYDYFTALVLLANSLMSGGCRS